MSLGSNCSGEGTTYDSENKESPLVPLQSLTPACHTLHHPPPNTSFFPVVHSCLPPGCPSPSGYWSPSLLWALDKTNLDLFFLMGQKLRELSHVFGTYWEGSTKWKPHPHGQASGGVPSPSSMAAGPSPQGLLRFLGRVMELRFGDGFVQGLPHDGPSPSVP